MIDLLSLPYFAISTASSWAQQPSQHVNHGGWNDTLFSRDQVCWSYLSELALFQESSDSICSDLASRMGAFSSYIEPDLWDDGSCIFSISDIHPHVLKAKSIQNEEENYLYSQAIHSPDADKCWEAIETELNTLEVDLRARESVCCDHWSFCVFCSAN